MKTLKIISFLLYWSTILFLVFMIFGCKSKEILWDQECAKRYPVKETFIQGKDYFHTDTLKGDCILVNCDPIILKAKCPPTLTITKTINRVDTVVKENVAQLALIQRERDEAIQTAKGCLKLAHNSLEAAKKLNKHLKWSLFANFGLLIFAFRKQLINLFKVFVTFI